MTLKQKNELLTLLTDAIEILNTNQEPAWLISILTAILGILSSTIKTKN